MHIPEIDISQIASNEYAIVILAAGLSKRMGAENKLLMQHKGQSLLERCVSVVEKTVVGEVVVVVGHERTATERALAESNVKCVLNEKYLTGQQSSVICGLQSLSGRQKATLICLADQPLIDKSHLLKLMWAFENRSAGKEVVVPMYNKQRGNPVVFSNIARTTVLEQMVKPDCRKYIDNNPDRVSWVSFDDQAYILDIDTPADFSALGDSVS